MKKKYASALLRLAIIAIVLFGLNTLLYLIPDIGLATDNFIYPISVVYLFFFVFSAVIISVLIFISGKNREQLGYAFLFLTGAKMAISYVLARPVINKLSENPTEKINFFVIFILFLIIEAYYTARLLNNK
ncbi:DUF6168 family protein [Flavobacterium alkalisoli]|uniref:DUF6168 family protein n=1 Tax=Flavobacterium alkalisoli TaxID=2602769 RepID=UPI003A949A15